MDADAELENSPYNATTETDDEGTEALTSEDGVVVKPKKSKVMFLRTIEGILMIVNTVLICLAWIIMAGWKNAVKESIRNEIESYAFFLVVTIIASIFNVFILVIFVLRLHETKLSMVNWGLTLMLTCGIEAFMNLITSAIALSEVANASIHCEYLKCSTIRAAGAFGVLSVFGLGAQCTIHLIRYLKHKSNDASEQ